MKQNKSSTNHITGERNVSVNSENDAMLAKKSSINFNKTIISGIGYFSIIINILISMTTIGVMTYLVNNEINKIEAEIEKFKRETNKNFIDISYTITNMTETNRMGI